MISMAGLALGAIAPLVPLVLIIFAMTPDTLFRRILVSLVDMAFLASDIGMFATLQMQICFFMIETGFLPILCIVTIAALQSEPAFMHIFLVVAGIAFRRRVAIFSLWFMAPLAFGSFMLVFQNITRFIMLEASLVKFRKPGIPTPMFGMTFMALFSLRRP